MSKALRVLITGAARGIGMATAQVLANRGHSVVATDLSALSGLEGIQAHVLDVTSDDSVARCLKEVGPLDAIVNNAAIFGQGPVESYYMPYPRNPAALQPSDHHVSPTAFLIASSNA